MAQITSQFRRGRPTPLGGAFFSLAPRLRGEGRGEVVQTHLRIPAARGARVLAERRDQSDLNDLNDLHQDRFRELCRQVVDEDADRWQQALPVRNESRDRGIASKPGGQYLPQYS